MTAHVNDTTVRVIGMSRSGNHAIVDWILAQAPGRTCLLNCAEPGHNPYLWARPLGPRETGVRANFELDLTAEQAGRFASKDYLVHSYEDVFLGAFRDRRNEARLEGHVGRSRRKVDVLILRDPYNLFASRLAARAGVLTPETGIRVWSQHARQFLGRRRYLPNAQVLISYNAWSSSADYRRAIATELGLEFDDAAARRVSGCAGGSSFDGVSFDGAAARMATSERWRAYASQPGYTALFSQPVRELAAAIFGELAPAALVQRRIEPAA